MVRSLSPCCLSLSFSCCLFLSSLHQIRAKYHSNNLYTLSFPDGTSGKEPTCQCRRCKREKFDPWVRMILWRRAWQPTLVFLHGESHGWRSLAGYSPKGHKESDTTEVVWHSTAQLIHFRTLITPAILKLLKNLGSLFESFKFPNF